MMLAPRNLHSAWLTDSCIHTLYVQDSKQTLTMHTHRSAEPQWDNQFAEMLVEVSHTSQSKKEQRLEDLQQGEGMLIGADWLWDPTLLTLRILASLAPEKHCQGMPLNIQASEKTLPGIMNVLARVSACMCSLLCVSAQSRTSDLVPPRKEGRRKERSMLETCLGEHLPAFTSCIVLQNLGIHVLEGSGHMLLPLALVLAMMFMFPHGWVCNVCLHVR